MMANFPKRPEKAILSILLSTYFGVFMFAMIRD